jgi:iron(III) transport system ATP-binding protein
MEAAVRLEGVSKRFGTFTALDAIDLEIRKGELICFLGPSGCGKTTLLRIIAGLEQHSQGRILQSGRDVSRLPTAERDFGIVFQSYALFPNLTVAANIGYGLVNQGSTGHERSARVKELLDLIGLAGSEAKFPAQLSGGQQQRVALARALATSPSLLLLDEPLSALDARVRLHLRGEILALQKRLGITTVLVTHDQEEALTMADRIVVMNHGVIEQVGVPEEVYVAPRTRFVAEFVGTMNFLDVTVGPKGQVHWGACTVGCDTRDLAGGAHAQLAVRPEDVHLSAPMPGGASPANGRPATVVALEFLGNGYRAKLSIHGADAGLPLYGDLTRREVKSLGIRAGGRCTASIADSAGVVFPCP